MGRRNRLRRGMVPPETLHNSPNPAALSLSLLLDLDFGEMFRNQARNRNEERISVFQGIFERP